jgi:cell division septum initiation protein DivIVA
MSVTAPVPAPLRTSVFGYDPSDVNDLLSDTRHRLTRLSDRAERAESATVTLVLELQHWKARAREAEASREEFERAVALATSTASATVAEAEELAGQLVRRARGEAQILVTRAQVDARRAQAAERKALRARERLIGAAEARLAAMTEELEAGRAELREAQDRWRRETAWLATQMLAAIGPRPEALPAEGDTAPEEPEVEDIIDLTDDEVDVVFDRFMSPDVAEEPSREWVLQPWSPGP